MIYHIVAFVSVKESNNFFTTEESENFQPPSSVIYIYIYIYIYIKHGLFETLCAPAGTFLKRKKGICASKEEESI